jgi:hypothetical protein
MTGIPEAIRLIVVLAVVIAVPAALIARSLGFVRDGVERLAVALLSALCAVILTGLLLGGVRGGYGFAGWAAAVVLLVGCLALPSRRTQPGPRLFGATASAAGGLAATVVLVAAAASAAVVVARSGASAREQRTPWVQLWIEPVVTASARYAIVGASAHDAPGSYTVDLTSDAGVSRSFHDVLLPNGAEWRARVRVGSKANGTPAVRASLSLPDGRFARRVRLVPAAWKSATGRSATR